MLLRLIVLFISLSCSLYPTDINSQLKEHIKFSETGPNKIGYIAINKKQAIDESTWIYVKGCLDLYKKINPIFILLDLDTPGGEVFSAEEISNALKDIDTNYDIPVVCFVDNWAISAGALLAYSCRFIGVSKDASMGAAEPVIPSEKGTLESASEKINSAFRTDLANRARFYDRNPYIAEAMVDKDIILVQRNGEIIKLNQESQILATDTVISPKGKLLTLDSYDLIKLGVADFEVGPAKISPVTDLEQTEGSWPAEKELLFQQPFFKSIPNAEIVTYTMDWKTSFFAFLAKPAVASILFLGLMIGLYVEFTSGGFGIAALVGLICLFLIILSSFSVAAANWLEMIILLIGLVLIIVELFVVPGFGIPGVIGIILTAGALILMMLPSLDSFEFTLDSDKLSATGRYFFEKLAWLSGAMVVGVVIITLLAKYVMPKFSKYNRFVLTGEQDSSHGYVAGYNPQRGPAVGSKGVTLSPLRPSGKILIENNVYDAMSEGGFIDNNKSIHIIRFDGSRMIVGEDEQ